MCEKVVILDNKMRIQLRPVIVALLLRIDWRKLFFIFSILTIVSLLIQISRLPYPLTTWILSPPAVISSFNSTNSGWHPEENTHLASEAVVTSVISSLNSSTNMNLSVPNHSKRENVSQNIRRKKIVTTPPPPPSPPPPPDFPTHLLRYIQSLTPEEALVYAKKEIENAPLVIDDPDLYAPLFRNISIFKRSYELMELILRVYIYSEGKRPSFHTPVLKGIYASEGWFMKQMEASRYFVTKDPKKAHLFYLPYSARQLQIALYQPENSTIKRISIFLRDYVNMLAAKYPFWNRTHGKDHFLVACHDWGPYTLVQHEELLRNSIKALCNADASEGYFAVGKDVSLPESTIRNPKIPQRNLGGKRASQRSILAFFAGGMHGRVRPKLVKYWMGKDKDMRIFQRFPKRISGMSYPEYMKSSKFCICPMGFEVNSPRIVEAIYYECVPVIIADNLVPPLNEVLDWSQFSVFVAEKDIPTLKEILLAIPKKRYLKMQRNVKLLQKHFLWNKSPVRYDLFHMILHSIWLSRLNQFQTTQSTLR